MSLPIPPIDTLRKVAAEVLDDTASFLPRFFDRTAQQIEAANELLSHLPFSSRLPSWCGGPSRGPLTPDLRVIEGLSDPVPLDGSDSDSDRSATAPPAAAKAPAKRSTATKAAAKTPAKKAPAKKAPAKQAAATKPASKAPAKAAPARKTGSPKPASKAPVKKAPAKSAPAKPASASAPGSASPAVVTTPSGTAPQSGSAPQLAIPDYDEMAASQVLPRLDGLSPAELESIRIYETEHRARRTILGRISQITAT